jgi:hypothetical protein
VNQTGGGGGGRVSLNDTSFLSQLDPRIAKPLLLGFSQAIDFSFLICGFVMLVAFILVFWLKSVPLSSMSGLQARAKQEADAKRAGAAQNGNGASQNGATAAANGPSPNGPSPNGPSPNGPSPNGTPGPVPAQPEAVPPAVP